MENHNPNLKVCKNEDKMTQAIFKQTPLTLFSSPNSSALMVGVRLFLRAGAAPRDGAGDGSEGEHHGQQQG